MIYRKAPPQPPRLLLRIVVGAGASVLLGATACGSDNGPGPEGHGSVTNVPSSGSDVGGGFHGSVVMPDADGGDAASQMMTTGVAPGMPQGPEGDASEEASMTVGGGVSPCHPCGTVPLPEGDSGSDAAAAHAIPFDDGGFLGIVISPGGGLQPAPEDGGHE